MATYRLKDKELQKKLDDISAGAFIFSEKLNETCQDIKSFDRKFCPPIRVNFGQTPGLAHAYEAYFNPDQIEKYQEYDPNTWNKYPDVDPPEGVWMRCEVADMRFGAQYVPIGDSKTMGWINTDGTEIDVERFRPWDE